MKSIPSQLEGRRSRLASMVHTLDNMKGKGIPLILLSGLKIDFNHLDKETGATHPAVTHYFLPRNTLPSCRAEEESKECSSWRCRREHNDGTFRGGAIFSMALHNAISSDIPLDEGSSEIRGQKPWHTE